MVLGVVILWLLASALLIWATLPSPAAAPAADPHAGQVREFARQLADWDRAGRPHGAP